MEDLRNVTTLDKVRGRHAINCLVQGRQNYTPLMHSFGKGLLHMHSYNHAFEDIKEKVIQASPESVLHEAFDEGSLTRAPPDHGL